MRTTDLSLAQLAMAPLVGLAFELLYAFASRFAECDVRKTGLCALWWIAVAVLWARLGIGNVPGLGLAERHAWMPFLFIGAVHAAFTEKWHRLPH